MLVILNLNRDAGGATLDGVDRAFCSSVANDILREVNEG